jgi:hypothetical protein
MGERSNKAVALFNRGIIVVISVCCFCRFIWSWDTEMALKVSSSFGGGWDGCEKSVRVFRVFMVGGMEIRNSEEKMWQEKLYNYQVVQQRQRCFVMSWIHYL